MVLSENEKNSPAAENNAQPAAPQSSAPPPAASKQQPQKQQPEQQEKEKDTNDNSHPDLLYKHPLENEWTLWYFENDTSRNWQENQNEITSFSTVEDFWSIYNHIKPPSEIKPGTDYSLFKKGIRPMWEDAANKHGGRWVINLAKTTKQGLDSHWIEVLLCLIGEAFDNSEQICGAVVNARPKNSKISIWTRDGNNSEAALEIGHKLRDTLLLRSNLEYQLHNDTIAKRGSSVKSIYRL